jgi:hypothetical protein
MCLTALRLLPAFVALFLLLAALAPADASGAERVSCPPPAAQTQARIDLYSPRVRHSTVSYLKLRLLELREAGLDRARAAIERRLSIDELLAEPAPGRADAPPRAQRACDPRESAAP